MSEPSAPGSRPLSTRPGGVTRWTVNVGPKTAEALNYVADTFGVSNTEALRRLAEAGYAALRHAVPLHPGPETPLPADPSAINWTAGIETEPRIGGLATVDVSDWPAGCAHIWLRVESYTHQGEYANIVLHPGEAHAIAAALGGAAGEVSRRRARDACAQPAAAAAADHGGASASALLTASSAPHPAPEGDPS